MKNLSWLVVDSLNFIIASTSIVIINFFLWSESNDYPILVSFNLAIIISLIIFSLLSNQIAVILGVRVVFALSLFVRAITLFYIFIKADQISEQRYLVGVLIGIYMSLYFSSRTLLTQSIIRQDYLVEFTSKNRILIAIASLLTPLIITFFSSNNIYESALLIYSFISLLILMIFATINVEEVDQENKLFSNFHNFFTSSKYRKIALINFSIGITYSLSWGILDILILVILGNFEYWAIIRFLGVAIDISMSWIIKKIDLTKVKKIRVIVGITALLYASITIFLLKDSSVPVFMAFFIVQTIYWVVTGIVTINYIYSKEKQEDSFVSRRVSFGGFNDFFINIGQFIPVLILLLLLQNDLDIEFIVIFLAGITIFPLLSLGAFRDN